AAVTFTSVCKSSGVPDKSRTWSRVVETTTLVAVSPDRIELRIEMTDEFEMNFEPGVKQKIVRMPRKVTHTRLMDAPPPGSPEGKIVEQSEKMIKVDGKPLKAKYKKVEETNIDAEGSVHTIQTWTSDDIPGGLIRQEQEMTGTYWFEYRAELTTLIKSKK
ncbi:MAG: hypothetical protein HY289_05780, partial [Planctomycetes bacterium]|nr:hypothetical protein [Planctomycetota bacterium]